MGIFHEIQLYVYNTILCLSKPVNIEDLTGLIVLHLVKEIYKQSIFADVADLKEEWSSA